MSSCPSVAGSEDRQMTIALRFICIHAGLYVRGGIRTAVTVEQRKKGWKPAEAVVLPGGAAAAL